MSWNPIPGQANVLSAPISAMADGSSITSGTVNEYIIADTGANAGKWFRGSDNSWQAAEAIAGAMTYKGGNVWQVSIVTNCWTAGVEYTRYQKESGDLNVVVPEKLRCEYPQDLLRIGSALQSLADLKDFADAGYDPATHRSAADLVAVLATALTETTPGWLAAAFKKFLNVEVPLLTCAAAMRGTDSAALATDLASVLAAVQAVQNNTRTTISLPGVLERPDAGNTRFKIYLNCYDEQGNMEEPDSAPTVAVTNQDGTDRSGNLQNPVTHVDTTTMVKVSDGRYWIEYEMASDHACPEALTFTFTIVEGAVARYADRGALVVDTTAVDFTATDRIALQAIQAVTDELPDAGGLDDLAAILAIALKLLKYAANKRTLSQAGLETVKADNGTDPFATRTVTDKDNVPVAPGAGVPANATAFVEA